MGAIQSGINQLFTTAGVMARLSPELSASAERRAALKDLDRRNKVATEQQALTRVGSTKAFQEALSLEPKKFEGLTEDEQQAMLGGIQGRTAGLNEEAVLAQQKVADIANKRWDLDPTIENLRAKRMAEVSVKGIQNEKTIMDVKFNALRSMLEKGTAQMDQKNAFDDLIETLKKEGY